MRAVHAQRGQGGGSGNGGSDEPNLGQQVAANHRDMLRFLNEVSAYAIAHPTYPLSRVLHDQGLGSGSSSESGFLSASGSFADISSSLSGAPSGVQLGVRAFFNSKSERTTLKPFVADLTHRCVGELEDGEVDPPLIPWRGEAAVLFIDLSGYSKISSHLISSGGAHAMSRAVNGYFEAILAIVLEQFQGDVIKFAGDAIVVVWAFPGAELRDNAMAAVACAMQLQKRCGMYPVEGTDLHFRMHSGIVAGVVDSEVFVARETYKMQRGFHFVSGKPFEDIGAVVDGAKTGEVCVSQHVADMLGDTVTTSGEGKEAGVRLVTDVDEDINPLDVLLEAAHDAAEPTRSEWLEKQLVFPRIASKLRQGFKLTHMAEMRFLCVLFINKAVEAVTVRDWFSELQLILDENRCPIVQIIDDDKGTHVVAAVNLYTSEPDCASTGLRVARELEKRRVGCSVGMACGECYCGVVGSEDACRWDVTGPACVRAARLMQYAVAKRVRSVFDVSVYRHTSDVSQLVPTFNDVTLKGTPEPLTVYGLSAAANTAPNSISAILWVATTFYPQEAIKRMRQVLNDPELQRSGHIINGPVGSGKKTLFLTCTQGTDWTPIGHQCIDGDAPLRIADTLGQWFSYHSDPDIANLALHVRDAWAARRMTHTLDLTLKLIDTVVLTGAKTAMIIQYGHLMDGQSMSLIREILRRACGSTDGLSPAVTPLATPGPADHDGAKARCGKFAVVITTYPLHGKPTAQTVRNGILQGVRQTDNICFEQYNIAYSDKTADVQSVCESYTFWKVTERFADGVAQATGGVTALVGPLVMSMRDQFTKLQQKHEAGEITHDELHHSSPTMLPDVGLVDITPSGVDYFRTVKWASLAPEWITRFVELYDTITPRMQLVLRAIAALVNDHGVVRGMIAPVVQKVMPKVHEEQVMRDVASLEALGILKQRNFSTTAFFVSFSTPAMLEVVRNLLTPDQDRVLKRMGAKWYVNHVFKTADIAPVVKEEDSGTSTPPPRSMDEDDAHNRTTSPSGVQFTIVNCSGAMFYQHRHAAFLWRGAGDREKYHSELRAAWNALPEPGSDDRARCESELASDLNVYGDIEDPKAVLGGVPQALVTMECFSKLKHKTSVGVEFCKNYLPSPALGALAGEAQKVAYLICNFALKVARPDVVYLTEDGFKLLAVNIENTMEAIDKFEGLLNDGKRHMTRDEEHKLLVRLTTQPATLEEVDKIAAEFMEYDKKVVQTRRSRIVEYSAPLMACLRPSKRTQFKAALSSALSRFISEPTKDGVELKDDPGARSAAFNNALMDLALAGWHSPYMFMTLPIVRDAVRRTGDVTEMELKAMVLSFVVFGTHLSFEGSLNNLDTRVE